MANSQSTPLRGTNQKLSELKMLSKIFFFFAMYITLLIISPVLLLVVMYRASLSLFIRLKHNGKFQLAAAVDAFTTAGERFANVNNMTFIMLVKGGCDIHAIRDRVKVSILTRAKDGSRPFGRLLKAVVKKFGFVWWEDMSETIDFNNHIKYCPDADDLETVYSETEAMAAIAKLADDVWSEERPRWEFVIVPKVKRDDESEGGEYYYCISLRMCHVYMDGISAAQFTRICLFDQPSPKLMFDPVNPPFPPLPFHKKAILYLQAFFLGPYEALKLGGSEVDPVLSEGTLTGEKFYGRMKMDLSLEVMRRIRKAYNCGTQAVLHSAFIGAIKTMTLKKGLPIPENILGMVTHARYPYPDEFPRNGAVFTLEQLPMKISDKFERLAGVSAYMKELAGKPYVVEVASMLMNIYGILPEPIMGKILRSVPPAYILSNVPGICGKGKINGSDVEVFTGFAPMFNSFRFSIGVGCYNGRFILGFAAGKTTIIANQKDMEEFITEFEKEVHTLKC